MSSRPREITLDGHEDVEIPDPLLPPSLSEVEPEVAFVLVRLESQATEEACDHAQESIRPLETQMLTSLAGGELLSLLCHRSSLS